MRLRSLVPLALALGMAFAGGGTAGADPLDPVLDVVRELAPTVIELRDTVEDPPRPADLAEPFHEDLRNVADYVKPILDELPLATP